MNKTGFTVSFMTFETVISYYCGYGLVLNPLFNNSIGLKYISL